MKNRARNEHVDALREVLLEFYKNLCHVLQKSVEAALPILFFFFVEMYILSLMMMWIQSWIFMLRQISLELCMVK